jgi:hypothetical protein
MAAKYAKWEKIDQPLPLQGPPKFTQNGIFGMKICAPSGNPDADPGGKRCRRQFFSFQTKKKVCFCFHEVLSPSFGFGFQPF